MKGAEILKWRRAYVKDRRKRKSKEQVIDCATGKLSRVKVGHAHEICFRKMNRIEPVDSAFMTVFQNEFHKLKQTKADRCRLTLYANSPESIFVSKLCHGSVGRLRWRSAARVSHPPTQKEGEVFHHCLHVNSPDWNGPRPKIYSR